MTAPADPRAALLARAFVARLWPGAVQLDLTLPQAPPPLAEKDSPLLLGVGDAAALAPGEAELLSGFRQAGGHLPLLGLDARGTEAVAASPLLVQGGRMVVHLAGAPSRLVADVLRRLPRPPVLLGHGATGWAESPWPSGPPTSQPPLRVMARLGSDRARFSLWEPGPVAEWGAAPAAGRALGLAARRFEAPLPGGGPGLMLEGSAWPAMPGVLRADRLLHDGGHASEGDAGYSWLWTGPGRQARFLLGALPAPLRLLRISIVEAGVGEALEGMTVFLDGIRVPHQVEWAEGNQRILRLPLPEAGRMAWQVLGLGIGALRPDGARHLGLCLDWLELRA